jgi:hypothetical protein
MRGGTNERRFQRFRERSVGEAKAMKAVYPKLRRRMADVKGNPWRPRVGDGSKVMRERGKGQQTRYRIARSRHAVSPKIPAARATLETHPTS